MSQLLVRLRLCPEDFGGLGQIAQLEGTELRLRRGITSMLIVSLLMVLTACDTSVGLTYPDTGVPPARPAQPWSDRPVGATTRPALGTPSMSLGFIVDGEERRFVELFQQTNPSVVHVHAKRKQSDTAADEDRQRMLRAHDFAGFRGLISDPAGGSGFVFDDDGLILTTNRVVGDAVDFEVTFADGTEALAMLMGADPNTDLAVLMVSQLPASARALQFGDSDSLLVGQRVLAVGNPLGFGGMMTAGVVSAKARNVGLELQANGGFFTAPDLIQTDAAILAGTVGGPLIDLNGQVVGVLGIDTLEFDAAGGTRAGGVDFSIPVSTISRVVPVLLARGRYPYPWLGISARDMEPDRARAMGLPYDQWGVLVIDVSPGSPAAEAGLRGGDQEIPGLGLVGGDVIVGFQGQPARDFDELVSLLFREGAVGSTVILTVIRDGEQIELPLRLKERPGSE